MLFSEFVQTLYPLLGGGMNVGAFVAELVDNFMENPASKADDVKAANGEYNPFAKLQEATLKQYYNGNSQISQKNAAAILGRMDKAKFAAFVYEFSPDALSTLCDDLKKYGVMPTSLNVGEVCGDLFEGALRQFAVNKKMPTQVGKEEISNELGIFPDGRVPMETVYLMNGRLHIGETSIKLSDKLRRLQRLQARKRATYQNYMRHTQMPKPLMR
ncbi:MAG: hypothetical protein LBC86_05610 [Oscillospiraceae bacterium]|jgi:hypothetical protein|nr:hypothetical protein [Oscillospiraceae bacterium]